MAIKTKLACENTKLDFAMLHVSKENVINSLWPFTTD